MWPTTPSQDKSKKKLVTSKLKIVHETLVTLLSLMNSNERILIETNLNLKKKIYIFRDVRGVIYNEILI